MIYPSSAYIPTQCSINLFNISPQLIILIKPTATSQETVSLTNFLQIFNLPLPTHKINCFLIAHFGRPWLYAKRPLGSTKLSFDQRDSGRNISKVQVREKDWLYPEKESQN